MSEFEFIFLETYNAAMSAEREEEETEVMGVEKVDSKMARCALQSFDNSHQES